MSDTLYCVYVLSRPNGDPFYVGMGSGERISFHEVLARRGERSEKSHIIRKIWADGQQVGKEIIGYFEWDVPAKNAERALIAKIGRKDCGTGPLVNRTDGGDGCPGMSGETAAMHRKRTAEGMVSPDVRERCRQNMARLRSDPAMAQMLAKQLADYWKDPVNRLKQSERVRAFNKANPERRAEIAELQRKTIQSEATREKMRAAKLGKKQNPEHVRNRAEAARGKKRQPGTGQRIAEGRAVAKLWRALLVA